jgi:hypothetical protein
MARFWTARPFAASFLILILLFETSVYPDDSRESRAQSFADSFLSRRPTCSPCHLDPASREGVTEKLNESAAIGKLANFESHHLCRPPAHDTP